MRFYDVARMLQHSLKQEWVECPSDSIKQMVCIEVQNECVAQRVLKVLRQAVTRSPPYVILHYLSHV